MKSFKKFTHENAGCPPNDNCGPISPNDQHGPVGHRSASNARTDLDEALSRSSFAKGTAIALQAKVISLGNKVRKASDLGSKLDLLAQQGIWNAALSALVIATDLNDKSILRGIRR